MPRKVGWKPAKDYFANPEPYLGNNPYIGLRAQMVRSLLPDLSGKSVLDLGCGDGRVSMPLAAEASELWLVDASAAMIETARRGIPPAHAGKIHTLCTDLADFEPAAQIRCRPLHRRTGPRRRSNRHVPPDCPLARPRRLGDHSTHRRSQRPRSHHLLPRGVAAPDQKSGAAHVQPHDTRGRAGRTDAGRTQVLGVCRYVLIPGIRALPPGLTRAIFRLTTAQPLVRFGGEVLALFSA